MRATTLILASAAILSVANASILAQKGYHGKAIDYDYSDELQRDEKCLCNEIDIQGYKIVTVNLDDHCKLKKYEKEGIFI